MRDIPNHPNFTINRAGQVMWFGDIVPSCLGMVTLTNGTVVRVVDLVSIVFGK